MTTVTPFQPTATQAFAFTPTLDGAQYNLIVTWNLAGARWYFNLYDLSGNLILAAALIASPDDFDINLVQQYFETSTLAFRESSNSFEVSP
jgi:hypothetical protein